jgi:hypothetical protein
MVPYSLEEIVRFVDIGGIIDHHCLNSLIIMYILTTGNSNMVVHLYCFHTKKYFIFR